MGQTAPQCNPLPDDSVQLQECLDIINQNPTNVDSTGNPTSGPGAGTWGMNAACNPTNNTMMMLATGVNGAGLYSQLYDTNTMQPIGQRVLINGAAGEFSSFPEIYYNETAGHYFVTWMDDNANIMGRFMALDGTATGTPFVIHSESDVTQNPGVELDYDATNSRYILTYNDANGPVMRTVTATGTVGPVTNLTTIPASFEGQASGTYVPSLNEYWYVYTTIVSGGGTNNQDDRIMLARVSATTMQPVGQPITLTSPTVGQSSVSYPQISFSTEDNRAFVVWQERGRNPGEISAIYGRAVYTDLSLGNEVALANPDVYPVSDFFGSPMLQYNPYTNSMMVAAEDNNGGTTYIELLSNGTVIERREGLSPQGSNGNFWPNVGSCHVGAIIMASANYGQMRVSVFDSPLNNPPPLPQVPPQPRPVDGINSQGLAGNLTRIYLYSLGLAALLAVMMAVFGGYLVMMARGNAAQAARGHEFMTSGLIGLLILAGAFLILNTLNPDLTDFNIPSLNNFT